jgi:hypothetical protein
VLWNAHVAFIPITLIVLASMIGQLMLRDGVKSFCTHRARSFIPAVVMVALFQVPLCIELSQRWPSPVRDYLTFGSDNPHNSLLDAVRFTVSFWPITNGLAGISWIVGLIVLVILGRRSQALGQALMCVVLSCTVAVFVYAVVGIDDLHLRYVALFYRAAVSLGIAGAVIAGAVIAGEERIGGRRSTVISKAVSKAVSMVSVAAIVLGFVFVWRQRPIVGIPDQSLLADSKRFAAATGESGARLHADIENWGFVWPRLVGLQVDADRRGATRSCIDTRWQVLFTVEAKCGASDQLRPDVRVEAALDAAGKPVHLNFVPIDLRLQTGDFFVPGAQGDADAALILGRGWSDIESGRIWTDTQTSSLDFSLAPGKQADVEFDVEGLIGGTQTEVRAEVLVNGDKVDSWVFNRALNRGVRTLTVRSTPSGRSVVEFTVSVHRSAAQLGLGPDRRKVGLALLRVDVHSVHNTA